MFDLGWTELLVIGIVALIVVGPKDLPGMFRTLGRFTGKIKGMAREFQRAMDQAADEAGVKDIKDMGNTLRKATDPKKMGLDAVKDATTSWTKPDSLKDKELGPETAKLAKDRAEAAEKIRKATAEKALERQAAEAAAAEAEAAGEATKVVTEMPEPDADASETTPSKETAK